VNGAPGDTGPIGSRGFLGAPGGDGWTGQPGWTGSIGRPGAKGIAGSAGFTGSYALTSFAQWLRKLLYVYFIITVELREKKTKIIPHTVSDTVIDIRLNTKSR